MSWDRSISLYVNAGAVGQANALLERKTSAARAAALSLIQGDKLLLKLYLREISGTIGAASTAVALDPTDTLILAAKATADLDAGDTLFSAESFTPSGSEDDLYYQAALDLDTANLVTALGTQDSLLVTVDIEISDLAGAVRGTFRFQATILRQVYEGIPADLDPGDPVYFTMAQVNALFAAKLNIAAGKRLAIDADGNITVEEIT